MRIPGDHVPATGRVGAHAASVRFLARVRTLMRGQVVRPTEHLYKKNIYYYLLKNIDTVCPGSSDPPEKICNVFASENEVYTIC